MGTFFGPPSFAPAVYDGVMEQRAAAGAAEPAGPGVDPGRPMTARVQHNIVAG